MAAAKKAATGAAKKTAASVATKTPAGRAAGVAAKARAGGPGGGAGGGAGHGAPRGRAPASRTPSTKAAPSGGGGKTSPAAGRTPTGLAPAGGKRPVTARQAGRKARLALHLSDRALFAEFLLCLVMLLVGGMTGTLAQDGKGLGSTVAIRGTALAGLFFTLGLVSSGGKAAKQLAAGLGLLVTLAYMLNDRKTIQAVADWAAKAHKQTAGGGGAQ
jgi:hypothetical protein